MLRLDHQNDDRTRAYFVLFSSLAAHSPIHLLVGNAHTKHGAHCVAALALRFGA